MSDTGDTAGRCGEVYGTGCTWNGETRLTKECITEDPRGPYGTAGEVGGGGCTCASGSGGSWAVLVALVVLLIRRFAPLVLLLPVAAFAVDAQHVHAVDGGDYAVLMDADQGEKWTVATWLSTNWGRNLVVLYQAPQGGPLLEGVQTTDFGASVNLGGFPRIGFLAPTYSRVLAPGPRTSTMLGDLTVWAALPLTRHGRTIAASISFAGDIPNGPPELWLGDTHGGATMLLATEFEAGLFEAALNLGPRLQRTVAIPGGAWGSRWLYGGALRAEPGGPVFLTAELHGAVPVVPWVPVPAMKPIELDGMLGTRIGQSVALSLGGGTGLSRGLGSPQSRVIALLDLRKREVGDRDADGINDMVDLCRTEPEDPDGYRDGDGCPDPDNDRDGFTDDVDSCPTQPETRNGIEDDDGCPDGASMLALTVEVTDGWYPPETATAWIGEAERTVLIGEPAYARLPYGPVQIRVEALGFLPQTTTVDVDEKDEPVTVVLAPEPQVAEQSPGAILERTVRFEEDSADLVETVFLDELAAYLRDSPEVELLRVEGHADAVGTPRYNYELSVERAEAVRDYLIEQGIAGERLQAVGSGEAVPGTDGGRRVGFVVLVFTPGQVSEGP